MSDDELRMSFTEHLGELRDRLIRSGIAVLIGVLICYIFSNQIFEALARPIRMMESEIAGVEISADMESLDAVVPPAPGEAPVGEAPAGEPAASSPAATAPSTPVGPTEPPTLEEIEAGAPVWVTFKADEGYLVHLKIADNAIQGVRVADGSALTADWTVLNPLEPIMVKFKIAGYGGLFLAMPFILFQLCAFIFPGLRPQEKKAAQFLVFGCTILAFAGVALAYFGVFPFVLPYLAQFVPADVDVQLRMNETISMIVKGLLGFGIAFQFPMAVLILVYMGVLDPATLRAYRKIVLVGLAVLSAILTPPDPLTMTLMLVPLYTLYECSIWLSYIVIRKRNKPTKGT